MAESKLWTQQDRFGHLIYLTSERWQHIIDPGNHPEVEPYLSHLRETVRRGSRRQDPLLSNVYKYYRQFSDLPEGMNQLVVVVVFRPDTNTPSQENNFIVTAYFQLFKG